MCRSRQIIHRDLKSSNLLIAYDQGKTVKVCDFSMSRLSSGGSGGGGGGKRLIGGGLGTPGYISPEELQGEPVTSKADTFSFAMILWELLTRLDTAAMTISVTHAQTHGHADP